MKRGMLTTDDLGAAIAHALSIKMTWTGVDPGLLQRVGAIDTRDKSNLRLDCYNGQSFIVRVVAV